MQRHVKNARKEDSKCSESWLEEHPWIRHTRSATETSNEPSSLNNEIMDSKGDFDTKIQTLTFNNYELSVNMNTTEIICIWNDVENSLNIASQF